jgi:hypothetical protein
MGWEMVYRHRVAVYDAAPVQPAARPEQPPHRRAA